MNRALAIAASAAVLSGCIAPTTYGTGVTPGAQTVEDIAGLVNMGGNKKAPIEYAARAPIVQPPTQDMALPVPGSASTATATNWPQDADEAARQKAAMANNASPIQKSDLAHNVQGGVVLADPGFRLPSAAGRPPDNDYDSAKAAYDAHMQGGKQATQLFAQAKANGSMAVDANGNPVRKLLSEPPTEYRVPDPEAPEAFTQTVKKKNWWWPF